MPPPHPSPARASAPAPTLSTTRRLLGLAPALLMPTLLAGCGGGGGDVGSGLPPVGGAPGQLAPRIASFSASAVEVGVGDTLRLRAEFAHGQGRIEPLLGPVVSGAEVSTPPLDRDLQFRLVVRGANGQEASASLGIRVRFRDRYATLGGAFAGSQHAAVATGDGRVLLIGGSRGGGVLSSSIDRFDPRTGSVTAIGQLLSGRANPLATRLPDGKVLVCAGELAGADGRLAELIDETTGTSRAAGRLSVPRVDAAAVALPGGRVLVTGGVTVGEGAASGASRSAEIWDPQAQTFRRLAQAMHTSRVAHSMTLLADGRVLIFGGYTSTAQPVAAEIFDPADEGFSPLASAQAAGLPMRANHLALPTPDGRVLVIGGERSDPGVDDVEPLASVLRFDPADGRFTVLPPLTQARTLVRGAVIPGGDVLLFGGQTQRASHAWSAERYNPAAGGQRIADLDGERAWHSVTRLPGGRIAVIGGESRQGNFALNVQLYE